MHSKTSVSGWRLSLVALLLAPALFVSAQSPAPAQTQPDLGPALQDLSQRTGQQISTPAQATQLCDQAQFFNECAQTGKKYNLYKQTEVQQVDAVLAQLKGTIVDDLKRCTDTTCIANVAGQVAQRINAANPAIAKELDLTPQKVNEKKTIISVARQIGVDPEQCRTMDPDTASLELLRSCAKLAKDSRIQRYIPENTKKAAEFSDSTTSLREALGKKEYQCGDNTLDGCGNFCLNPSEATRSQGIPGICREIAEKFFGSDGVQHLQDAYQHVQKTNDFYQKKATNVTFTTPDGHTLTDPEKIGQYLQDQGQKGNVEVVDKGLDFMVSQGFIKPEEKDFALKFVKKIKEQGGTANFDACGQNPESCRNFIPDDQRQQFDAAAQVSQIIRQETGFDPNQCAAAGSNPDIGKKCFEGARQALPQIEAIIGTSPNGQRIISDLKSRIARQEEFHTQQGEIQRVVQQSGGPGGCRSDTECRSYCSDPAHGGECIAFGAKNQISGFKGQEAIQRFQEFNQSIQNVQQFNAPFSEEYPSQQGQFPGQGQQGQFNRQNQGQGYYPPFQPGQNTYAPGPYPYQGGTNQQPGFGQPYGQPYYGGPNYGRGPGDGSNQSGPSPECFTAISQGDFVKAREVCAVHPPTPSPIIPPQPPQIPPGQPQEPSQPGVSPRVCPSLPTVTSCSDGEHRVLSFSSPECGPYYRCERNQSGDTDHTTLPLPPSCPQGQYWNGNACVPSGGQPNACPSGQYSYHPPGGGSSYCRSSESGPSCGQYTSQSACPTSTCVWQNNVCNPNTFSGGSCPSGQYWYAPTGGGSGYCRNTSESDTSSSGCAQYGSGWHTMDATGNCFDPAMQNYRTTNGTLYSCASTPATGCTSGTTNQGGTCPAGQYWFVPGGGPGYCRNNTDTSTSGSQCETSLTSLLGSGCHRMTDAYFNGAMTQYVLPGATNVKDCSATYINGCSGGSNATGGSCPSGQYWYAPTGGGSGYCRNTSESDTSSSGCAQYGSGWHTMDATGNCFDPAMQNYRTTNGTLYSCASTPATGCTSGTTNQGGTCPAGQYWNGSSCVANTSGSGNCASGQYWNGTACVTSTGANNCASNQYWNGTSCVNSSSSSGTSCTSGQYWNGSACVSPTGSPSSSCTGGQYWNGSSCISSPSNSCPSGQYWNGTACISSSPSPSTTCPSDQYWNGSSCVSSSPPPSSTPPPNEPPPSSSQPPPGSGGGIPPPSGMRRGTDDTLAQIINALNNILQILHIR